MGKMIHRVKPEDIESVLQPFLLEEERLVQIVDLRELLQNWLGINKREGK